MIAVTSNMQAALDAPVQRPDFRVLSYDISSATGETWGAIIEGTATQEPVDLTSFVTEVRWSYSRVSVTLADESLRFHPDSGDLAKGLCPGRAVRILEGDTTVPQIEWISTFFGLIQGPYEWALRRNGLATAKFNVYTRESNSAWRVRNVTGKEFTVGSDWSNMFRDLVEDQMGLTTPEIAFDGTWGVVFDKTSNQIVNAPAWDSLEQLMLGNFNRIWFNGNGQIAGYPFTLGRVNAELSNSEIVSYSQPGNDVEIVNKVSVEYIDNELTRVVGGETSLGTANLTAGFYDFETKLDVFYSDDKKQRADDVRLVVQQSINQNGLGIKVGSENLNIKDEFGGELIIHVDEWVSALATAGIAAVLASIAVWDVTTSVGGGLGAVTVVTAFVIPIGKALQTLGIVAVMLAMMILGNGIYEIVGKPVEWVFLEKKAVALVDNIKFWEEKEKNIRMEMISTEDFAHELALTELLFSQSQGHPRQLVIRNNPRIEPGDILELDNGTKFYVESATKTLTRGANNNMSLTGFRSIV